MNEELLRELMKYIQEVSPEIWIIAQQQVQVEIWRASIGMWGFGIVSAFFLVISLLCLLYYFRDDADSLTGFLIWFVFSFLFGIIASSNYVAIASRQMNPDYYAILSLIQFVK